MKKAALWIVILFAVSALAQTPSITIGGGVRVGKGDKGDPGVGGAAISGTPTTGNCTKWIDATHVGDAGAACGAGGGGESPLTFNAPLSRAVNAISIDLSAYYTVSAATTALALKAPIASPTFTGTVTAPEFVGSGSDPMLNLPSNTTHTFASGDVVNNAGVVQFHNGSAVKSLAFTDGNITGTSAGITGKTLQGTGALIPLATGTATASKQLTYDASGNITASAYDVGASGGAGCTSGTPAYTDSTGTAGACKYDTSYFYTATATNSWKRVAWDATWTATSGAATIFSDGFETGNFTNWTAQSTTPAPTVQSTIKSTGTYAAELIADTQNTWIRKDLGATYTVGQTIYAAADIYNTDRGSGTRYDFPLLGLGRSADQAGQVSIMWGDGTNTSRFIVYNNPAGTWTSGTANFSFATWYRVKLKVVIGDVTAGSLEARLYSSTGTLLDTITLTGIDTYQVDFTSIWHGQYSTTRSYGLRVDNVAVSIVGWPL